MVSTALISLFQTRHFCRSYRRQRLAKVQASGVAARTQIAQWNSALLVSRHFDQVAALHRAASISARLTRYR